MSIDLIRRFEPILYFHQDETFFPSDAKRYLEHCALWEAKAPFQDTTTWRKVIDTEGIAAAPDEVSVGDGTTRTYLGQRDGTHFPFLESGGSTDHFLNPSGWIGEGGSFHAEVGLSTDNRLAAIKQLANFYGQTDVTLPALHGSRFWYHAEVIDTALLSELVNHPPVLAAYLPDAWPVDLAALLQGRFHEPRLLLYHLFYPARLEGIPGCESVEVGANFSSFAGAWDCIAILLDRDDPTQEFSARWLGLCSRNADQDSNPNRGGRVLDPDGRVGMVMHGWDEVDVFATAPDHVKLFVAKGTHSLYLSPDERDLQPLTPGDPAAGSCGLAEPAWAALGTHRADPDTPAVTAVVLAKLVGSVGALSLVGAGAAGVPVGLAWCLLELGSSPLSAPFGQSPPTPFGTQHDTPPPAGQIGTIVHPVDFTPPDQAGTVVSWPPADTIKVNGRQYTTLVHRDDPDPAKRQVWFPPRVTGNGYRGRWGPRVAPDPLEIPRRAGMRLPEFAGMFFTALAKRLSA